LTTEMASGHDGHVEILSFELFPSHTMAVCLFEDVKNAAEIRAEVLQQKFDASFLDATMVQGPNSPSKQCVMSCTMHLRGSMET